MGMNISGNILAPRCCKHPLEEALLLGVQIFKHGIDYWDRLMLRYNCAHCLVL